MRSEYLGSQGRKVKNDTGRRGPAHLCILPVLPSSFLSLLSIKPQTFPLSLGLEWDGRRLHYASCSKVVYSLIREETTQPGISEESGNLPSLPKIFHRIELGSRQVLKSWKGQAIGRLDWHGSEEKSAWESSWRMLARGEQCSPDQQPIQESSRMTHFESWPSSNFTSWATLDKSALHLGLLFGRIEASFEVCPEAMRWQGRLLYANEWVPVMEMGVLERGPLQERRHLEMREGLLGKNKVGFRGWWSHLPLSSFPSATHWG